MAGDASFNIPVRKDEVISAPWLSRYLRIWGWSSFAALDRMYLRSSAVGSAKEASDRQFSMRDWTWSRLSASVACFNNS